MPGRRPSIRREVKKKLPFLREFPHVRLRVVGADKCACSRYRLFVEGELKKPRFRQLKRLAAAVLVASLILLAGAGVAGWIFVYPRYVEFQKIADAFDLEELHAIPAISEVFDVNGQRYSRLEGEVRYVVPYDKISPNFINALLAREDSRFYEHKGVDFQGIARAAWKNLRAGGVEEGASTITQQLARNTFVLDANKWRRKVIEALLALRIEKNFSKEQILEAYSNRIYYGRGLYGVETAARACFGKTAAELSLSEAGILAGLIRSPNRLSPLERTATALRERDQVLARMEEMKMITPAEASAAREEAMPLAKRLPPVSQRDYAMDAVVRDLAIVLAPDVIERGGLKIYTTIDRRLQLIAQDAVEKHLADLESQKGWAHPTRAGASPGPAPQSPATESPFVQGALLAVDNQTGGILAIVGGRDFQENPYNRALLSVRQIGSTFKPFVYAAAFQRGMRPGTLVDDGPIEEGDIAGAGSWSPRNSDGRSEGLQPASLGLIRSRNTMSVRVGEFASLPAVHDLAVKAGLADAPEMPAIYLGAFGATLKSLVGAYTLFANNGVRRQPYIIERIEDRYGKTIYKASRAELRCLNPAVNYLVNELLRDVVRKGTASAAGSLGLTVEAAGKTGTTDEYKDAWFLGYTTRLTCGVWVGLDRPQTITNRGYGSALALPIWVNFMEEAARFKYEAKAFPRSELVAVELCRSSGMLATPSCREAGAVYLADWPKELVPVDACSQHGPLFVGTEEAAGTEAPPPVAPAATGGRYRVIRKQNGFIFENR
jgi:penicillin-binding protein 1A